MADDRHNPPAFGHGDPTHGGDSGMTLRDYFAGQALPQAVEDYGEPNCGSGQRKNHGNPVLPYSAPACGTREEIIARQAYRYADAMLQARKDT